LGGHYYKAIVTALIKLHHY